MDAPASILEVLAPDSRVMLSGEIEAGILAVSIGPNAHVRYEVVWWDGKKRRVEWVEAVEVAPVGTDAPLQIGFRTDG